MSCYIKISNRSKHFIRTINNMAKVLHLLKTEHMMELLMVLLQLLRLATPAIQIKFKFFMVEKECLMDLDITILISQKTSYNFGAKME